MFLKEREAEQNKFENLGKFYQKKVEKRKEMVEERDRLIGEDDEVEFIQQIEIDSAEEYQTSDLEEEDEEGDESDEEIDSSYFIPRIKIAAYQEVHGKILKTKTGNKAKLTNGTDPLVKNLLEFMVNPQIACPRFLPMEIEDAKISGNVMNASLFNPDIPLSEYCRKEFYWHCIINFREAITADPALMKQEVTSRMKHFDDLYCLTKTPEEEARDLKFTQGDFNRFSAIFYLALRKMMKDAAFLVKREKKKRVMPRHLLTAAVLSGIIPRSLINDRLLSMQRQEELDMLINRRKREENLLKRQLQPTGQSTGRARGRPK